MSEFWLGVCAAIGVQVVICGVIVAFLYRSGTDVPDDACPYCGNPVE